MSWPHPDATQSASVPQTRAVTVRLNALQKFIGSVVEWSGAAPEAVFGQKRRVSNELPSQGKTHAPSKLNHARTQMKVKIIAQPRRDTEALAASHR